MGILEMLGIDQEQIAQATEQLAQSRAEIHEIWEKIQGLESGQDEMLGYLERLEKKIDKILEAIGLEGESDGAEEQGGDSEEDRGD